MLRKFDVEIKLAQVVTRQILVDGKFDSVVLATGVSPRRLELEGADHPKVLSYLDVLDEECRVGHKVAIIGSGGIGIDVAHFLTAQNPFSGEVPEYLNEYGILGSEEAMALLKPKKREVTVIQRSSDKIGKKLGKTTGWAHIQTLKAHGVKFLSGAKYLKINDSGLHLEVLLKKGEDPQEIVMDVDNVIVAAGQEPLTELVDSLRGSGLDMHIIGGAKLSSGLDAKTAINDGAELAAKF